LKKHFMRFLVSALLAVLFTIGIPAALADRNLPDGFLIGDDQGITVGVDGSYFINVEDPQPEEVITKTLTVQNLTDTGKADLTMTMEPLQDVGPANFMDNVFLKLTMDGKTLYEGKIRGDGTSTPSYQGNGFDAIKNALVIGTFDNNDVKKINIELKVDSRAISNEDLAEPSHAEFKWNFYAVKRQETKEGPKTGEIIMYGIYILLGVLLVAAVILLVYRRKLKKQQKANI